MEIDRLEIKIESSAQQANKAIDSIIKNLGRLTNALNIDTSKLGNIGKSIDLSGISKQTKAISESMGSMGTKMAQSMKPVQEQAKKTGKAFSEITEKLENKFSVDGISEKEKKQIEEYTELLNIAIGKKESLEKAGATNTDIYKEAISDINKYQNAIENTIEKISAVQKEKLQIDFGINGLEESEQAINNFSSQIENMKNLLLQTFSDVKSGDLWRNLSESVGDYVKSAQVASGIKVYTEDYKNILNDIERAEGALEKLDQKQRDLQAAGIDEESKEWQRVASEITAAQNRLDSYINARNAMESSGSDVEFSGGLANESILKSVGVAAGEAMSLLREEIGEIGGAVSQAIGEIPIIGRIAKESAFIGQAAFNGLKTAISGISKVAGAAVGALSKIASAIAKLASGIKGIISKLSSMVKSFIGLKSASRSANTSFGDGLKTMLKYGLGIRSLYALMNKLRTAMKEGFKNLAQYSSETNSSLSMLKSSLGAVQNALAVAFAPIVNVIAPYLSMLIDMVVSALNALGRLFAMLTGKSFAVQAKKNFSDYSAGVSGAGKAAKKAGEDVQKGIRAFDELKTITINDQESGGGGGGSGGADIGDMFETVEVDPISFNSWGEAFDSFLDYLLNTGIPALRNALSTLADWINTFAANLYEMFTFPGVREKVQLLGQELAEAFNDFTSQIDWAMIGKALGAGFDLAVQFLVNFIWTYNWMELGKSIAEMVNNAIEQVDWYDFGRLLWAKFKIAIETFAGFIQNLDMAELARAASNIAMGFLDSITETLNNIDWQTIGNQISTFIGNIDYSGISTSLFTAIGAALASLSEFLWGLVENAWKSVVKWWKDTAYEDGKFTMEGLLNGILEVFKNIGTWIKEHIFQPFINGFKEAFGIHSPSTVMQEQGTFIMQGLLNGINSMVQSVIDIFNNIKEKIVEVWNAITESTSQIWGGIKSFVVGLWEEIKTSASTVFDGIKKAVEDAWNGLKTATESTWNGIKEAIRGPINAIIGFINKMIDGVTSGINSMIDSLNQVNFDVPEWVPGVGGKNFGLNISRISSGYHIPQLAKGGIVEQYTPAIIGEAGMEAVLPLTNKRSMSMVADSILEGINYNGMERNGYNEGKIEELITEVRQQNELLRAIYEKPTLSDDDVFNSTRRGQQKYQSRTWKTGWAGLD